MADPVYKAVRGSRISNRDAAVLGPAWEKLERRLKRAPTPDDLVAEARKPSSPFHKHFEWNPEKQQILYLRHRAYQIIRSLDVVFPDRDNERVRGIVPTFDGDNSFISTNRALRERPDVIQTQVQRAKADARSFYLRYEQWIAFAEFSPAKGVMAAAKAFAYES